MLADQLANTYVSEYEIRYQEFSSATHLDSELKALAYFNGWSRFFGGFISFLTNPVLKARVDAAQRVLDERAERKA